MSLPTPNVHMSVFPELFQAQPSQKCRNPKTDAPPNVECRTKGSRTKDRRNNRTELGQSLNAAFPMQKGKS